MNDLLRTPPKSLQRLLLALITVVASLTAAAREETPPEEFYDVEVIIYASLDPDTGEEYWPTPESRPDLTNAWYFDHTPALQPLPREDYQLDAVTDALARSTSYRPLLHFAWRQPGWGPKAALPVRINIPFGAHLPVYPESQPLLDAQALTANWTGATTRRTSREPLLLEGKMQVHRSRYLHLGVDLLYREHMGEHTGAEAAPAQSPDAEPDEILYQPIRMRQSRRMRSEELHYLDHPRLGVIARISKVKGVGDKTQSFSFVTDPLSKIPSP